MHGELLAERLERGRSPPLSSATSTPILPRPGGGIVDVGDDHALLDLEQGDAADRLVFADRRDIGGQFLLDGAAARPAGVLQRLDVAAGLERDRRDGANEILELVVLRDEVGLAN